MYKVENDKLIVKNVKSFFNRPMYFNSMQGFALCGEVPAVKLVYNQKYFGSIFFAIKKDNDLLWIHNCDYTTNFQPNNIVYDINISENEKICLNMLTPSDSAGLCLKVSATFKTDIYIVNAGLSFCGEDQDRPQWALDGTYYMQNRETFFNYEYSGDDFAMLKDGQLILSTQKYKNEARLEMSFSDNITYNKYSIKSLFANDFIPSFDDNNCFVSKLNVNDDIFINFNCEEKGFDENTNIKDAKKQFTNALKRNYDERESFIVETPSATLNLATKFAVTAHNATFIDSIYNHGAMAWSIPFPGWETIYGAIALSKIENIEKEAEYYTKFQIQEDINKKSYVSKDYHKMTIQHPNSCFYGKGRIDKDQNMYNFQSIFFQQLIEANKKFNSSKLTNILKTYLPLHCFWQNRCFDPQNSNLYESYINTWPTDTMWNNGGKGVEETFFAYNVLGEVAKILDEKGDTKNSLKCKEKQNLIKEAFKSNLWIKEEGHSGFYKDVIGEKLLHKDAWIYSILYSISSEFLTNEEKVESLYYTEYGLERVQTDLGGERTYTANFIPHTWSTRELNYAEDFQLANAYFQCGLKSRGYYLFKSAYEDCTLNNWSPMSFGSPSTATDFTAILSTFLKTLTEGLFGIKYENNGKNLLIKPSFPLEWKTSKLIEKLLKYKYSRNNNILDLKINSISNNIEFIIDTYLQDIDKVLINDVEVEYVSEMTFLTKLIRINYNNFNTKNEDIDLRIVFSGNIVKNEPKYLNAKIGDKLDGLFKDNQGVLDKNIVIKEGNFTLFKYEKDYIDIIRLNVERLKEEPLRIPENRYFIEISLEDYYNGDLREIYKQEYLSPRVKTCSAQIGYDLYTSWCYSFWNMKPPCIDLSIIEDYEDKFKTPTCFFYKPKSNKNMVAISQYDNFPTHCIIPINKTAKGIFIIFIGATNQMQTLIPAAKIKVNYTDGESEVKEIVPPNNFLNICDIKQDGALTGGYYDINHNFPLRNRNGIEFWLGKNARANIIFIPTNNDKLIKELTIKAIANETVIGIVGLTLLK